MNALIFAARHGAVLMLLVPLACAAAGLLRGALPSGRPSVDPPGVQVIQLPTGALLKRMPGQAGPGDSAAAPAGRAAPLPAGVTLQQSGAAQMQVLAGTAAVPASARPGGLTARPSGGALLLEMPGQRSLGAPAAGPAAPMALPGGVRIVDLAANEPLPLNPQPNTLYRRQN